MLGDLILIALLVATGLLAWLVIRGVRAVRKTKKFFSEAAFFGIDQEDLAERIRDNPARADAFIREKVDEWHYLWRHRGLRAFRELEASEAFGKFDARLQAEIRNIIDLISKALEGKEAEAHISENLLIEIGLVWIKEPDVQKFWHEIEKLGMEREESKRIIARWEREGKQK